MKYIILQIESSSSAWHNGNFRILVRKIGTLQAFSEENIGHIQGIKNQIYWESSTRLEAKRQYDKAEGK